MKKVISEKKKKEKRNLITAAAKNYFSRNVDRGMFFSSGIKSVYESLLSRRRAFSIIRRKGEREKERKGSNVSNTG